MQTQFQFLCRKTGKQLKILLKLCLTTVNVRKENNDLRNENKELQISIEFCHNQTNDLKKHIDELQSNLAYRMMLI